MPARRQRYGELGSFRKNSFWLLAGVGLGSFCIIGLLGIDLGRVGYPAGGTGRLYRWMYACGVRFFFWARFAPSLSVFGVALSLILRCIIPESLVDVKY